jgi:hypothetical protein
MKHLKGDLIESDVDALVHCCNNHHVMGSGIAYFLAKKFPQVYEADLETERDCETKMGSFSKATISNNRLVYNLYAMWGIGNDGHPLNRNLSYDSFHNGLWNICEDLEHEIKLSPIVVGLPKYIGCCRAGGVWSIVEKIIEDIESKFERISFEIYELENGEMTAQSTSPTFRN